MVCQCVCTYSYYPFFLFSPSTLHLSISTVILYHFFLSLAFISPSVSAIHNTTATDYYIYRQLWVFGISRYCRTRVHPYNLFPVEVTGFNIEKLPRWYTWVFWRFLSYRGTLKSGLFTWTTTTITRTKEPGWDTSTQGSRVVFAKNWIIIIIMLHYYQSPTSSTDNGLF